MKPGFGVRLRRGWRGGWARPPHQSGGTGTWGAVGGVSHRGPAHRPVLPALTDSVPRGVGPGRRDPGVAPSSPASESEATGRASGLGARGSEARPADRAGQGAGGGRARSGRPRGSRGPRPPRPAPGAASTSGCGRRAGRAPGRPRGRRQRRAETIAPRPQPAWRRKAAAAGRAGPGPHLGSRAGNAPPRRALGAEGPGGLSRPRTARFLT